MNRSKLFLSCVSALAALSMGCGGDDGGEGDTGTKVTTTYVVDSVKIPSNVGEGNMLSRDMNNDGVPDNALGNLLSQLTTTGGVDVQGPITEQFDQGGIILLASLAASSLGNATNAETNIFFAIRLNQAHALTKQI